jgi:hypothetical protein
MSILLLALFLALAIAAGLFWRLRKIERLPAGTRPALTKPPARVNYLAGRRANKIRRW